MKKTHHCSGEDTISMTHQQVLTRCWQFFSIQDCY